MGLIAGTQHGAQGGCATHKRKMSYAQQGPGSALPILPLHYESCQSGFAFSQLLLDLRHQKASNTAKWQLKPTSQGYILAGMEGLCQP